MAGPWEQYANPQVAPQGPWTAYQGQAQPEQPAFSGSILPFSRDAKGNVSFDSNAGIVGAVKRAVTLPRDVVTGAVDPRDPNATGRILEAATVLTPGSAAMRAGERVIPGAVKNLTKEKPPVPTAEELRAASDAGYKTASGMGVDIRSQAISDMARGVQQSLEQAGIIERFAPDTFEVLKLATNPPAGSFATIQNLETIRQSLRLAAKNFNNPREQLAAERAIRALDEFSANMPPEAVLAGPAAQASGVLSKARGNYAAASRSDRVTGATERAELNAAVANSGQNIDNAIRQRMRDIAVRPKEHYGFSPEELAGAEGIARGGAVTNAARTVGNVMGGGGGMAAAIPILAGGLGHVATGNPMMAALAATPLVGAGIKKIANAITRSKANRLDEMIRERSPLFEERLSAAPMTGLDQAKRAALARALAAGYMPNE